MDYTLRPLQADDLFSMVQLLSKLGLKEIKSILNPQKYAEISKLIKNYDKSKTENEKSLDINTILGIDIIGDVVNILLKNLPFCKNEIYTLLSNLSGIPKKDFYKMPLVDFTEMVIAVVNKDEFKDFFKVVSKSFM